jgi:hypothetical protein
MEILPTQPPEFFQPLLDSLNGITIATHPQGARRGFPKHRNCVWGISRGRFNGKVGLSTYSQRYPAILQEMMRVAHEIAPNFEYNSIQLNKDLTCPPHRDDKNRGTSLIFSIGDYTGSDLVIEGRPYTTKNTPMFFDGGVYQHWNTPDLQGTKYSLIYFTNNTKKTIQEYFV